MLTLCFASLSPVLGQVEKELSEFSRAQAEFDNGNYAAAIEVAEAGIEKARISKHIQSTFRGLDIIASSQISSENYDKADLTLKRLLT